MSPPRRGGGSPANRTAHQQRIIKNYYDNLENISLANLSELATQLYLATPKQQERLWERAAGAMEKLKVPASRSQRVLEKKDPALLAQLVTELSGR